MSGLWFDTSGKYWPGISRTVPALLLAMLLLVATGRPAAATAHPSLNLTPAEQQWLDSHPGLKIGIRETPPLVMRGEKGEGYRGLSIDYIERMATLLGTDFNLIWYPTWQKLIDETRNRSVDIIITGTITLDRTAYLDFTPPYITLHNKIIVRKDIEITQLELSELAGMTVAAVEGTTIYRYIEKTYPGIKLVATRDEVAALEAVSFGEVHAAVMEMARASYYIEQQKITNLAVAGDAGHIYNFCFSSRNDWPELHSILTKALAAIPEAERKKISQRWIYNNKPNFLVSRSFWITSGALLTILTVMLIVGWNLLLRRRVARDTAVIKKEVAELARAETELRRMNRTLMVLGKSHELLMQFTEETSLFPAICKHLVEIGGYRSASVVLASGDKLVAVASFSQSDDDTVAPRSTENCHETGVAGRAIRTETVTHETPAEAAGRHEGATRLAIPLWGEGSIIGALAIESAGSEAFDDEEVALLTELTENLAYTVVAIRLKEEHRGAEEQLRKLSLAIEQSPVTIVITNKEGTIEYVNPYFTTLTGYSAAEAIGANPRVLKSGIHSREFYSTLWDIINGGFEWHGEFCNRKKSGELFWESASISPVRNSDGEITHFIAVKEDITDKKKAYEELQKAKAAAEAATSAKSSFLANMSHEIRTPMNAVLGMLYLVQQTALNQKQQGYIAKAEGAAKSLLKIINDILDFSKIEAGRLQMETIPFLLSDVLTKITDIAPVNIGDKPVELIITVTADTPELLAGDPLRLGQVLLNLLSNGIKFTAKGEVVLSIGVDAISAERVRLNFRIADSGIGMTAAQLENLFGAFSQADSSTTRKFGGTGLGLTISKQLVQLMGGDIKVESTPGVGSVFSFAVELTLEEGHHETIAERFAPLKGMRLLHAGAERRSKRLTGEMLASCGLLVEATTAPLAPLLARPSHDLLLIETSVDDETDLETMLGAPCSVIMQQLPTVLYTHDRTLHDMESSCKALPATVIKPAVPSILLEALVQAAGLSPEMAATATNASIAIEDYFTGRRILLVEDNQINQEVAKGILERWGIQVDIAANGAVAVDILESSIMDYDAVLMDLQMPVMDGIEATCRIRASGHHQTLPIIAMTASAMTDDRARCLAAGMNDHVAKPIDIADLFAVLHRWFRPGSALPAKGLSEAAAGADSIFPEKTPGIDLEKAVRRLGSRQILLTVLREFRRLHSDDDRIIAAALEQGAVLLARGAAHTLKGLARTIGAEEVGAIAAETESALATGDTAAAAALLPTLGVSLQQIQQTLAFVDQLPADSFLEIDSSDTGEAPSPEAVAAVMQELAGQFAKNNLDAVDNVRKLIKLLAAEPLRGQLDRLENCAGQLKFREARTILNDIAGILNINLAEELQP